MGSCRLGQHSTGELGIINHVYKPRQRLLVTLGLIAIVPVIIISMCSYRYFNNVWVNMNTLNLAYLKPDNQPAE